MGGPFKIYRKNCCGLDVHKTWIYACIGISDDKGRIKYYTGRFSSFRNGLNALLKWLTDHECMDVCMESSGKYWIPVFNILEKHMKVCVAHPKYTKPLAGSKSNVRDARHICNLYMCDMIQPSFIPPQDIRDLRDTVRHIRKLTYVITGEKNRVRNSLTVCNFKLDDVFSDVFGKSSSSIIAQILEHPGEHFDVTPFVKKTCKASIADIQAAVDGKITETQALKIRESMNHIRECEQHIANFEEQARKLAAPYEDVLKLIRTAPGLDTNPMTAVLILSEIGPDISVFPTAKHLVSWAGCCPRNDSSAGKVKSTRMSRAGTYLKPTMVQVANGVVRSKKYPECRERFLRIKSRRGHKRAIFAVIKMLLTSLWHMLSKKEEYNPSGYVEQAPVRKKLEISPEEALEVFRRRGYNIVESEVPEGLTEPPSKSA